MEPPEEGTQRRISGGCSVGRIINLMMAFVFLLILVTAIVVIGILGALSSQVSCYLSIVATVRVVVPPLALRP